MINSIWVAVARRGGGVNFPHYYSLKAADPKTEVRFAVVRRQQFLPAGLGLPGCRPAGGLAGGRPGRSNWSSEKNIFCNFWTRAKLWKRLTPFAFAFAVTNFTSNQILVPTTGEKKKIQILFFKNR